MRLFIDTACSAFAVRNQDWEPHCVRVAALLEDDGGEIVGRMTHLIRPEPGWDMNPATEPYHKATPEDFHDHAVNVCVIAHELGALLKDDPDVISHNAQFHDRLLRSIFIDADMAVPPAVHKPSYCTMARAMPICRLPTKNTNGYKPPRLSEAFQHFAGTALPVHQTWHGFGECQVKAVRIVYKGIQGPPASKPQGRDIIHGR